MNILVALKQKYDEAMEQMHRQTRVRHQLNMNVDLRQKEYLKALAKALGLPRDIVAEHVLETGNYYIGRILQNEKLAGILRKHLTTDHLLDGEMDDHEWILRLGESNGNISELLAHIDRVLHSWDGLQRASAYARKTGNVAPFEAWKKDLMNSSVKFAEWLDNSYADEPDENNARGEPEKEVEEQEQDDEREGEGEDQDEEDEEDGEGDDSDDDGDDNE